MTTRNRDGGECAAEYVALDGGERPHHPCVIRDGSEEQSPRCEEGDGELESWTCSLEYVDGVVQYSVR